MIDNTFNSGASFLSLSLDVYEDKGLLICSTVHRFLSDRNNGVRRRKFQ